jgi:hypothetical protein
MMTNRTLRAFRDSVGDLVLQIEDIADVAVEPFRPQMRFGLRLDQLNIDADLIARATDVSSGLSVGISTCST